METEILDAILELLSDGNWHTINEVSTQQPLLKTPMNRLAQVLNVFEEYGFIEFNQKEAEGLYVMVEVKLSDSTLAFLRKIRWAEACEK